MLYLLFVLTFLAGILFYGMTPRDDRLEWDTRQSEGMVVSFLNQHQAAQDYLFTWLGAGIKDESDATQTGTVQSDKSFLTTEFEQMMPNRITSEMCKGNAGNPGKTCPSSEFVSRIVCAASNESRIDCDNPNVKKRYVVTYGGGSAEYARPDWWPDEQHCIRRNERWRRAIAKRTRGSHNCGVLIKIGDDWCIDNGQRIYKNEHEEKRLCANEVPQAIIETLKSGTNAYNDDNLKDMLFCYSAFKQGVNPGHYAKTPSYFYDGLSNVGIGIHKTGKGFNWINLVSNGTISIDAASGNSFNSKDSIPNPYLNVGDNNGAGSLNTNITLGSSFTLTILASLTPRDDFDLFSVNGTGPEATRDSAKQVFTAVNTGEEDEENPGRQRVHFCFGPNPDSACVPVVPKNKVVPPMGDVSPVLEKAIISWTFTWDGSTMKIYENATSLASKSIPSGADHNPTNKNLWIGTTGYGYLYGIRYYDEILTKEEIQKNFKIDQMRFGIADVNNGLTNP